MKGLLIMLLVVGLIGWLVATFVGWPIGTVAAVLLLVGCFFVNRHAGTTGLFKANLNSYFAYRRKGQPVDQAIMSMVQSRYWFSKEKQEEVLRLIAGLPSYDLEEVRVCVAVYTIFLYEQGRPREMGSKVMDEIQTIYRRLARQHSLPGSA